jgi:conjugal transfer pilus assembly protein TraU
MTSSKFSFLFLFFLAVVFTGQSVWAKDQTCRGKFPNPIKDICWSCALPIRMGGAKLASSGQEDNNSTSSSLMCACTGKQGPDGTQIGGNRVGFMMGFWEPARLTETVRTPNCFPSLNGVKIDFGVKAIEHGQYGNQGQMKTAFYHQHWYMNPLMSWLEVVMSDYCMEMGTFDLAYVTEIDPLWDDNELAFVINPDVFLFGNLISQAVCVADCLAASFDFGRKELFWCAGCQGVIYPLTGWVASKYGLVQTSALLTQRIASKMHRQGIMWAGAGKDGQCGMYMQPLMDKSNYKYQLLWPTPQTEKINGRCCQPFGRSTILMEMGKEYPYGGEDASWQIFRKRDCCDGNILNWIM